MRRLSPRRRVRRQADRLLPAAVPRHPENSA
jgi:hypothetical protein